MPSENERSMLSKSKETIFLSRQRPEYCVLKYGAT